MARGRKPKNLTDIDKAKEFGKQSLEDAKAGKIQAVRSENQVDNWIPVLEATSQTLINQPGTNPAPSTSMRDMDYARQEYAKAMEQFRRYQDFVQDQNASRNAQRRAETGGKSEVLGTSRKQGEKSLTAKAQHEIDSIDKEISSLERSFTGDAGVDEATSARIGELKRKRESINKAGRSKNDYLVSREDYTDKMQDPELAKDISNLEQITRDNQVMGVTMAPEAMAKTLTGMGVEDYYKHLEDKYGLSREELDDMALTNKADKKEEQNTNIADKLQEFGEKHPVLGSAASLYGTLGQAVESAYNLPAGLITNDDRYKSTIFNKSKKGLREGAKENIDTNAGKTVYDVGMGLGDLAAGVATGNAPLVLAGNTANEAYLNTVDKGQSARKAAMYGGAAGVADYYFNKIGLDKAKELALQSVKTEGVKRLLANMGIAGLGEAGENLLQDISQTFLDEFINKDYSDIRTSFADKIENGMDATEAFKAVAQEYAMDRVASAATGFVMGAGMMGGSTLKNEIDAGLINHFLKKNSQNVWDKVAALEEENLNPAEMASQNEIDIPTVEATQAQALDAIKQLEAQIPAAPESGVDNLPTTPYDESTGGIEYGEAIQTGEGNDRAGSEGILRGIREDGTVGEGKSRPGVSGGEYLPADRVPVTEHLTQQNKVFDDSDTKLLMDKKISHQEFFDSNSTPETFTQALATAKANNEYGGAVEGHNLEDIQNIVNAGGKTFLVSDASAGGAVTADGNLTCVFKDPLNNDTPQMGSAIALAGVKDGAVKGDCFGRFLVNTYSKAGFEPVGRCKYAFDIPGNEDMDAVVRRQLEEGVIDTPPDVYAIKLRDGYDFNTATENFNTAKKYTQAELDALPLYEGEDAYDLMLADRDRLLGTGEAANEIVENSNGNGPAVPPDGGNVPPGSNPPGGNPPNGKDTSLSRFITNTATKAGIVEDGSWETDPELRDIATQEVHHNDEIRAEGEADIAAHGDEFLKKYLSDEKGVDTDVDFVRAMTLLQKGTESGALTQAQHNALLRRIVKNDRVFAEYLQAHNMYANTSEEALLKAERVNQEEVKHWESRNTKIKEKNNRIAQAIFGIGKEDAPKVRKTPLTHDELKEQIRGIVDEAFGEKAALFNDDDIEYLTILAETKRIPVRTITKELEHKLETGEWFTIDESLPIKAEKAIKNGTISNMLDRIVNGEVPKADKEPEAYGRFLKKIRNSLQDESIGLGDEFDDLDVYFIGQMFQAGTPKKIIEDELRHRIETGEWYTIDESLEAPKPTNQKLQNAFKQMRGEVAKTEPVPKTYDQIKEEVRNTLEKNGVLKDYSEEDIDYVANLIQQGFTTSEIADALNTKSATGRWGVSAETQEKVNRLFEYARHYDENSEEFVEAQAEAFRLLAEEVAPNATPLEKFDAWRYMAMLGNPKTMLRNYVGNKLFGAVTGMSNNLAAAMEMGADAIYHKATGNHIQRTKAFINPKTDKALLDATALDARHKRARQIEGTKYEKMDKDALRRSRSVWDSDVMQLAEKALDKGISDKNAVIKKYSTSLAGYMKANGLTKADLEASYEFDDLDRYSQTHLLDDAQRSRMESLRSIANKMEKARDYALEQAEYATFHEDNAVAKFLTEQSTKARESDNAIVRGLGYALEGTVPFKKTPANILRSGFEYSPFGALKSIAETGKLIYENTGSRKGNLEDEYTKTGKLSGRKKTVQKTLAADVIDSWAKTLTGTGLTALGYYLFNRGILTSSDKGEKYQDQLEGKGNYAININGHTYTLDWAAPGVMPLLVGAEINKVFKSNGKLDEEWYSNPDRWMETVNGLLDPMLETSMLSGLKDTLQTAANEVRYNEENALGGILGSVAGNTLTGYMTQAIPTLSGQIARTIDPIRRTTDTANEGILGTIEKQARKVASKIPVLSMINPEYRDAYGRGQTNGPFGYEKGEYGENIAKGIGNLAYQMLSPGYYSKVNTTDADRLGRDLYGMTDENGKYIPSVSNDEKVFADWRSTKKIDGIKLDPEQMQTFREDMGTANKALREGIYNSEWYGSLAPESQAELVKALNNIADKIGQYSVMPDHVNVNGTLKTYLEAGGGDEGIQAVIDELEADYNPYGLKKETYQQMKADGEDLSKYVGYGDILAEGGATDKKAYREAWLDGGEAALRKAIEAGDYIKESGTSANSKVAEAINEAVASGDTGKAQEIVETSKTLADYGLTKPAATLGYDKAAEVFPSITIDEYAKMFKSIDADGNQGIKQDELINYFNKEDIPKLEGEKMWDVFSGSTATLPVLENGVWKKQKVKK